MSVEPLRPLESETPSNEGIQSWISIRDELREINQVNNKKGAEANNSSLLSPWPHSKQCNTAGLTLESSYFCEGSVHNNVICWPAVTKKTFVTVLEYSSTFWTLDLTSCVGSSSCDWQQHATACWLHSPVLKGQVNHLTWMKIKGILNVISQTVNFCSLEKEQ